VVYYIYAALKLGAEKNSKTIDFSVPTGNFGDIFAGYVARRMLPKGTIGQLVLATNENNLLTRFVQDGDYSLGTVVHTNSPSMDIQVASNFERYLYFLFNEDAQKTAQAMQSFAEDGKLKFDAAQQELIRADFTANTTSEEETLATISDYYRDHGYILDPHTAVGVNAASTTRQPDTPMVCLATAHPAKFGEAVNKAIGRDPKMPASFTDLEKRPARCEIIDAKVESVRDYLAKNAL